MYEDERIARTRLNEISVIHATPADCERIHEILERATEWLAKHGMNHWNGSHTKERILADFNESHILLAQDPQGIMVGTVAISFATPWYHQPSDKAFWAEPESRAAYIRKLAVIPAMMKKGVAAKLLVEAELDGRSSGALFARLDTNPAFPELVPYYQGHGYTRVGMRDGSSFFEKRL